MPLPSDVESAPDETETPTAPYYHQNECTGNRERHESETGRADRLFVTATIGLEGTLLPDVTFDGTCAPKSGVLAIPTTHAVGPKGKGERIVTFLPRPSCLTMKQQVLPIFGCSEYSEERGNTYLTYVISQNMPWARKIITYLEVKRDESRSRILNQADIVGEEHLKLFHPAKWRDVEVNVFADSANPPTVWVEESLL
jgi:hypothetical protein